MSDSQKIKKLRKEISELDVNDEIDELWSVVDDGYMYRIYPTGFVVSIEDISSYTPASFEPEITDVKISDDIFSLEIIGVDVQTSNFESTLESLNVDEAETVFAVSIDDSNVAQLSEFNVNLDAVESN